MAVARQLGVVGLDAGSLIGGVALDAVYQIQAHTASDTLTAVESGKLNTNRGASGVVLLTLPTAPVAGTWFAFRRIATFAFRVVPPVGVSLRYSSGAMATAEYLEMAADESGFAAVYDGTDWLLHDEFGTLTQETP